MASYLRPRRGKKSTAETQAIVLKKGEVFFEIGNDGTPTTGASATAFGKIKMGDGTTTYSNLGYFIDVDTSVVDWDNTGYATATSENQGADLYGNLNAIAPTATLKSILGNVKALLYKLSTQVTTLNNECSTDVSGTTVYFNFTYDATEQQYGCLDVNGDFIPFNSGGGGGIDTSDATAVDKSIESGYTAYARGEKITGTAIVNHTLSKYTGSITDLSVARYNISSASIDNYALFAGGYGDSGFTDIVEAYNGSFSKSTPAVLSAAKDRMGGASVGNYAIFGGGCGTGWNYTVSVDAYDTSLTKTVLEDLSVVKSPDATSVGNYALFGGRKSGLILATNPLDIYNNSLTKSMIDETIGGYGVTNIKNQLAIFASGAYGGAASTAYAVNTSLTITQFSVNMNSSSGGSSNVGQYAIFQGYYNPGNGTSFYMSKCDTSLTASSLTNLSQQRQVKGVSVTYYAIFGAGNNGGSRYRNADAYNQSLSRSTTTNFSYYNEGSQATATLNKYYGIFAGGRDAPTSGNPYYSGVVEAYSTT